MTLSLWTEASRDLDAETTARRMANAKVAVAGLWPFLTLAKSQSEFEHRLALTSDHIANAVPVDLLEPVQSSLREDYRLMHTGQDAQAPGELGQQGGQAMDNPNLPAGPTPAAGGAPAGGSSTAPNTPAGPSPDPSATQSQMSVNTPMTQATGAKDAQGQEDAAEDDDRPDWLKEKIDSKESMYFHQASQRWVAARVGTDPEDAPEPWEAERDAEEDRRDRRNGADPNPGNYSYSAEDDPWYRKGSRKASFWHATAQRWVTAAVEEGEGGGNPYYFTGGPEAGPNTGQTNQFPPHPTGADPIDPLNQMFPMQPTPWTVPPGGEWKEAPMNFDPPEGNRHAAGRHPFTGAAEVHHPGDRVRYDGPGPDSRSFEGTVIYGANHPDYGNHYKVKLDDGTYDMGLAEYTHKASLQRRAEEGVEGRPGPNSNYFADGSEGVSGDQQQGFPADITVPGDREDRVNALYGQNPISGGWDDSGNHVAARQPENPAPNSDTLLGTDFDSDQERERWNVAQDPQAQQDNRGSFVGARHTAPGGGEHAPYSIREDGGQFKVVNRKGEVKGTHDSHDSAREQQKALYKNVPGAKEEAEKRGSRGFFDPTDPGVRTVAADDLNNTPDDTAVPGQDPGSPGWDGSVPQSTEPRQIPGGNGGSEMPGAGFMGEQPEEDDGNGPGASQQSMTAAWHLADGQSYERPDDADPTGAGDEYDHNTWDGPIKTRPRQPAENRNVNTPQSGRQPIPTVSSPSPGSSDEADRREALRVAQFVTQNLGGVR